MNQKTKRILLVVILVVSLIGVGVGVGWSVGRADRMENTGEELESLRDTIKIPKTETEETDPVPTEDSEPGETEPAETEPDSAEVESEEIVPAVTETSGEAESESKTETETVKSSETESEEPVTAPEASEVPPTETPETPAITEPETESESATAAETEPVTETEAATESKETETETKAETAKPTVSAEPTLDFEHLQTEVNPDIHAWIEIANTKVDYPVLQSPDDDEKYLTTAYDGTRYDGGALFTQATYNGTDFNDRVTFIYGHTLYNQTAFGQLQLIYSDAAKFAEHNVIKLYLPDEVRYYTIFAAVPYEDIHVMGTYDFSVDYWYKTFFKNVKNIRTLDSNFDLESFPEIGDRVIVLSSCYYGDSAKRYLIMAVNQSDLAAHAARED